MVSSNISRWLYSVKKNEQAREAIQRMARWDGYRISTDQFETFEKNMASLISSPFLLK